MKPKLHWNCKLKSTSYEFKPPRVTSSSLRVMTTNQRVTSSSLWVTSSNLRFTNANPRVTSSNSWVTSSNPRDTSSNPRVMNSNLQVSSSDPRIIKSMKIQVSSLKSSAFLKIVSPKLFGNLWGNSYFWW